MKFKLQENDIEIVNVGPIKNENGSMSRTVTFQINGKDFDAEILVSPDDRTDEELSRDDFYTRNKETIDSSLIDILSSNNLYYNK